MPIPVDQQVYCINSGAGGIDIGARQKLGSDTYTIGFWMQLRSIPARESPGRKGKGYAVVLSGDNRMFLCVSSDRSLAFWMPYFDESGGHTANPESGPVINLMQWHYIHVVFTPSEIALWVDGRAVPLGGPCPTSPVWFPIRLGNLKEKHGFNFQDSNIDVTDLRVWTTARSDDRAYLDQYVIPSDPAADASLAIYADLTVAPPQMRKTVSGVGSTVALSNGAKTIPLGIPCDRNVLLDLFHGTYDWEWFDGSTWHKSDTRLTLSDDSQLFFGSEKVERAVTDCDGVHWNHGPHPQAKSGSAWLMPSSSNPIYWGSTRQQRPCLEGVISSDGSSLLRFRGVLLPRRSAPFLLIQQGRFLAASADLGWVVLEAYSDSPRLLWTICDDNTVWNNATGGSLATRTVEGSALSFIEWGPQATKWAFAADGSISPIGTPKLAATASLADSPRITLENKASPIATSQIWASSGSRFQLYDHQNRLLTNGGSRLFPAGSPIYPDCSWYFFDGTLMSARDGRVITAAAVNPDASIGIAARDGLRDNVQRWSRTGDSIQLESARSLCITTDSRGILTLKTADPTNAYQSWSNLPRSPADVFSIPRAGAPSITHFEVAYDITIQTSSDWMAGTGDGAGIDLWAGSKNFLVIADFEIAAGSKKTWTASSSALNGEQVDKITLTEGGGFFPGWKVEWVEIYDRNRHTIARFNVNAEVGKRTFSRTGLTSADRELILNWYPGNFPMSECNGPRLIDHTYLKLTVGENDVTYFGCAGGVEACPGDVATLDVMSTRVGVNSIVRMATGGDGPRKSIYGPSQERNENADILAQGARNRTGFCHQIANRLLYVGAPRNSISDLDYNNWPRGYALGCLLFGKYGPNFAEWCSTNRFDPPATETAERLECIQRIFPNASRSLQEHLAYIFAQYRAHFLDSPEFAPKGSGIAGWREDLARRNESEALGMTAEQVDRPFHGEL